MPDETKLDINRLSQDQRLKAEVSTETADERVARLKRG
jgi:hypothetical protein